MKEDRQRTSAFAKDQSYEEVVATANRFLALPPLKRAVPTKPIVLITGAPRSGTTLLYQVLAASGAFAYPSNFVARYYSRPAMGVLAQRLARPWLPTYTPEFRSRAGATGGWKDPHEFGYFWEQHLPFDSHHEPSPECLDALDLTRFTSLLAEFEQTANKPLLFKSVLLPFVLPLLSGVLPTLRVLTLRRDPVDTAASLLKMRKQVFDDEDAWFSVRPRAASELASATPVQQVAAQLASVSRALSHSRECLGSRCNTVSYKELCDAPRAIIERTVESLPGVTAHASLSAIPPQFEFRSLRSKAHPELEAALAGANASHHEQADATS